MASEGPSINDVIPGKNEAELGTKVTGWSVFYDINGVTREGGAIEKWVIRVTSFMDDP